ncbi:Fe(3+)-dicitrate ABC transporter ATP-binding protein [Brachybacterium endophyticum]|uniref:Fe(3+)-dicitrate ABC transporter ATP-binding protein n=1 Tax=Brachybacterium endophyticum TaxID=2182385 RepID=A0A2U2RND2_9MICO|nr:ABC transporter ATP-binding protein [Brachybacterium endophyticum]PWH07305.1 Fe(3+)-dicitrate ABC transporter ATP-binding protein [Brachybacterium endophyticum]
MNGTTTSAETGATTDPGETATSALALDRASVGYGEKVVLDEVSLTFAKGRFTAVVGPNGCGKSTMLRALARTLPVREGRVLLDGRPLAEHRSRAIARRLALLPQEPVVPDGITVRGLVDRGRHPYRSALRRRLPGDAEAVETAMRATGVDRVSETLVTGLSGGQRQRAWIAMVLAQQTEHVLLDEPTSFLDIAHQIDVLHLCQDMRADGRTVVAVLHDLNQAARYADEIVVLHEGRVRAQGAPHEVIDEALLREVFGLEAEIARDPQSGTPLIVPRRRSREGDRV